MALKESNLFIVGMPRSGTTLVSNMLNASGQIYIGSETHFYQIFDIWKKKKRKFLTKKDFISFFFDSACNPYLQYLDLSSEELNEIKQNSYRDVGGNLLLELLCSMEARKKKINRWGEKTPGHFEYIDYLLRDFDTTRIINIIRDPRDVFLSLSKVDWSNKNPLTFCLRYKKNIEVVKKYINSNYFKLIKYEDLVANPEDNMKEICFFMDITYSNKIIKNFNKSENINYDVLKEPWKANNAGKLNQSNFGKWKKDISNKKIYSFISWFLTKELKYLDYEFVNNNSLLENYNIYAKLKMRIIITRFVK